MKLEKFLETISGSEPPAEINDHLKALWYDKKGDWESAHSIVQILNDKNAEWIHAYLHRKEGDPYNASYWYRKANKSKPDISLDEEWENLADLFLRN
jgi:hypothetical protein